MPDVFSRFRWSSLAPLGPLAKRLRVGSAALIVLASGSAAIAADMKVKAPVYKAPPPSFSWSGFYVGAEFGYLWGSTRVVDNGVLTDANAATDGAFAGGIAGVNWQNGNLVLGLETDFGWTNASGIGTALLITDLPNRYDVNWTGTVRGRAGFAGPDMTLFYVTGGLALADFRFQEGGTIGSVVATTGAVFTGWTAGGGIEKVLAGQFLGNGSLIGRAEYLYADYGSKTYTVGPGDSYNVGFKAQTVRVALIAKFN